MSSETVPMMGFRPTAQLYKDIEIYRQRLEEAMGSKVSQQLALSRLVMLGLENSNGDDLSSKKD